ncbi:MAG: hypothetical protein KGZ39_08065 [Simkania sp.]|nr:hypothetical protein [Simkania sp.]
MAMLRPNKREMDPEKTSSPFEEEKSLTAPSSSRLRRRRSIAIIRK